MKLNYAAIANRILIKHFPEFFTIQDWCEEQEFRSQVIPHKLSIKDNQLCEFVLKEFKLKYPSLISKEYVSYAISAVYQHLTGIGADHLTLQFNDYPVSIFHPQYFSRANDSLLYDIPHHDDRSLFAISPTIINENVILDIYGKALIDNNFYYIGMWGAAFHVTMLINDLIQEMVAVEYGGTFNQMATIEFRFEDILEDNVVLDSLSSTYRSTQDYCKERFIHLCKLFQKLPPLVYIETKFCYSHPEMNFIFFNKQSLKDVSLVNFYPECLNKHKANASRYINEIIKREEELAVTWFNNNLKG